MVDETVPKDILDKLNAGITITGIDLDIRDLTSASDSVEVLQDTAADLNAAVVNAAGTGLVSFKYGSSDGGTTWYPEKLGVLADTGTLRAGSNVASDSTVTLYTVPANTVFYLTSASLQNRTTAADSGGNATLKVATLAIIDMESVDVADSTEALSISPIIPIKLIATQTIQVVSSTTGNRATGAFVGYEVAV